MARTFKDESGNSIGKRGDLWLFQTHELRLRPENCGRYKRRSPEQYAMLRASILLTGQTDPVIIQQDGQIPAILDGMGRYEVICDLNEHELKNNPMKVAAVYKESNPVEGLWVTINQNRIRTEPEPLDDSFNIRALKRLNLTDEEIAEGYFPGCLKDKAKRRKALLWVSRRESLLGLTQNAKEKLASGEMALTTAEHLSKLQKEQQEKIMKEKDVTGAAVAQASGKVLKLKARDIRQEIDNLISDFAATLPKELNDALVELRERI